VLRNQDLNLLPIFDALMQEQQLSRAAERLCMSQPAVSNALKRLRISFRDDLFVRTRLGLKPTQRAVELHEAIAPVLESLSHTFDDQTFSPEVSDRTLDISMDIAAEYVFAPDVLGILLPVAPNLRIRFHPDHIPDIAGRLKDGRLNYALEYGPVLSDEFDSAHFADETLSVICAKSHPSIKGSLSLEQYTSLPHVSLVPRPSFSAGQTAGEVTPVEYIVGGDLPTRNIGLRVASSLAIPEIVATTDLIATLSTRLVLPLVESGELQRFDPPFNNIGFEFRLYWHKSRSKDPFHQWFINELAEHQNSIRGQRN